MSNKTNFVKKLLTSPFGIAAIAGVFDLSGGAIGMIADIWWLLFDTVIKTDEFSQHYIGYGIVFALLFAALIAIITGIYFTIKCYLKYSQSGLEAHERKLVIEHKKSELKGKNRNKSLK